MLDLQQIAYELCLVARSEAKMSTVKAFIDKSGCYDHDDPDDVKTAAGCVNRAFTLCEQAESISRQMIQAHDHTKAIARLKKSLPGFSDETYALAIEDAVARLEL